MKPDILSSGAGADAGDLNDLQIDNAYARRLEHNKKRESLHRLQELKNQGRISDSDSDTSSDSEPDPVLDIGYLRALDAAKNKDPILKQSGAKLFTEPDDQKIKVKKKEKPMYLKDVNARTLIELGPEGEDLPLKHKNKIYKSEQAEDIRAFHEAEKKALESENGDDDFLKQKEIEGEEPEDTEIQARLDNIFNESDEGDMFLKEYLRDQKWIDKEKDRRKVMMADVDISEDENELEKQEKYEVGFNFRYEEAEQADRVLGHSRVMEGSVRKKKSSRDAQRKSKKERMEQAEFERKEELKYLKNLKKKEIQEKLEKIRAIAGIGEAGSCKLDADDLEEDFDPEEYDKKMKDMFGDDYYGEEEDPEEYKKMEEMYGDDRYENGDPKKPIFSDDDDELIVDGNNTKGVFAAAHEKYLKQHEEGEHEEGSEVEESEDKEPEDGEPEEEEPEMEEGKRKKKKQKISLKEKVALEKELEEYYKLDYEDTIDDLKTRFKYKTVKPNRFGLKCEEIWQAEDKNLNQYVPLKKIAPYAEEWETKYHMKKRKRVILGLDPLEISKKPGKSGGESSSQAETRSEDTENLSKRSKRRHRQKELKLSQNRRGAYGKGPAKPQKKKH